MRARTITFFGGDAKVGTTMLSQCAAEVLAQRGAKVLLVFASSEMHDSFISDTEGTGLGLDFIIGFRPKLEDIERITNNNGLINYIKGASKMAQVKQFSPYCLSEIKEVISDIYDYILIDGGHNYQYPLPCSALLAGERRYYVMEGCNRSLDRLSDTLDNIVSAMASKNNTKIKVHIEDQTDDKIILNKYDKAKAAVTAEVVKGKFKKKVLTVPLAQNGYAAETNNKTLYMAPGVTKTFQAAINAIADDIEGLM